MKFKLGTVLQAVPASCLLTSLITDISHLTGKIMEDHPKVFVGGVVCVCIWFIWSHILCGDLGYLGMAMPINVYYEVGEIGA